MIMSMVYNADSVWSAMACMVCYVEHKWIWYIVFGI